MNGIEDFINQIQKFKESVPSSTTTVLTRGQIVIPKLKYKFQGKYIIVENYNVLCKFTGRSIKFLSKFFATKLGTAYQANELTWRIKGVNITLNALIKAQDAFYKEQVLCDKCSSPDTLRDEVENKIKCNVCLSVKHSNGF